MRIVLCNASPDEADALASTLVEERLAACVNLLPVRSVYRWEGAVQQEPEITLVIKTTAAGVARLRERVLELHSYDLPEFVVLAPDIGTHAAYAAWVAANVT